MRRAAVLLPLLTFLVVCARPAAGAGKPHPTRRASPRAQPAPSPPPPESERLEGFGSETRGGDGGRVITITDASQAAVRKAFQDANRGGHAILRFQVHAPIIVTRPLPLLTAPHLTIDGGGATLDGSSLTNDVALLDVRTHDVVVRDLRLRNGYDNLRVQGPDAAAIVITHVSSTGSADDGISIGYGAHDVTVQYTYLAGNTRSIFCKYGGTTNVSLHHLLIQKAWIRSPLLSGPVRADLRNLIIEDWTEWGSRFEDGAAGNVVASLFVLSPYAVRIGGKADSALRLVKAGPVHVDGNAVRGETLPMGPTATVAPLAAPRVTTSPVAEMEAVVRARAGCLPHDAVDRTYMELQEGWAVGRTSPLRLHP